VVENAASSYSAAALLHAGECLDVHVSRRVQPRSADGVRWNVSWGLRLFACLGLAVMLFIGEQLAFAGARTSDRIGGVCFLIVLPVGTWLFFWRPYVELSPKFLYIRNPLRSHLVRLEDIQGTFPLNTGLSLELTDGEGPVAWALQQGLLMTLLFSSTRSDRAGRTILGAARAVRRGEVPDFQPH
jgi:hypothetical protein